MNDELSAKYSGYNKMKILGRYGRYIIALFHEPEINQQTLSNNTGQKPSRVSREVKELVEIGVVHKEQQRNQNILKLTRYGEDIYRVVLPYSSKEKILLSTGVRNDLISLFLEFDPNMNDILKKDNFESVKKILLSLNNPQWDGFKEADEYISVLISEFLDAKDDFYQQFPLQLIQSFVENGYRFIGIMKDIKPYYADEKLSDGNISNYLVQKIYELVFIGIKQNGDNSGDLITEFLSMTIQFSGDSSFRSNLYEMGEVFKNMDREIREQFRSKIRSILKADNTLKSRELEHILKQVVN